MRMCFMLEHFSFRAIIKPDVNTGYEERIYFIVRNAERLFNNKSFYIIRISNEK